MANWTEDEKALLESPLSQNNVEVKSFDSMDEDSFHTYSPFGRDVSTPGQWLQRNAIIPIKRGIMTGSMRSPKTPYELDTQRGVTSRWTPSKENSNLEVDPNIIGQIDVSPNKVPLYSKIHNAIGQGVESFKDNQEEIAKAPLSLGGVALKYGVGIPVALTNKVIAMAVAKNAYEKANEEQPNAQELDSQGKNLHLMDSVEVKGETSWDRAANEHNQNIKKRIAELTLMEGDIHNNAINRRRGFPNPEADAQDNEDLTNIQRQKEMFKSKLQMSPKSQFIAEMSDKVAEEATKWFDKWIPETAMAKGLEKGIDWAFAETAGRVGDFVREKIGKENPNIGFFGGLAVEIAVLKAAHVGTKAVYDGGKAVAQGVMARNAEKPSSSFRSTISGIKNSVSDTISDWFGKEQITIGDLDRIAEQVREAEIQWDSKTVPERGEGIRSPRDKVFISQYFEQVRRDIKDAKEFLEKQKEVKMAEVEKEITPSVITDKPTRMDRVYNIKDSLNEMVGKIKDTRTPEMLKYEESVKKARELREQKKVVPIVEESIKEVMPEKGAYNNIERSIKDSAEKGIEKGDTPLKEGEKVIYISAEDAKKLQLRKGVEHKTFLSEDSIDTYTRLKPQDKYKKAEFASGILISNTPKEGMIPIILGGSKEGRVGERIGTFHSERRVSSETPTVEIPKEQPVMQHSDVVTLTTSFQNERKYSFNDVKNTYEKLRPENLTSDISIADIQESSGIPMGELHEILRQGSKEGKIIPTYGEPMYATAREKSAALNLRNRDHLFIKIPKEVENVPHSDVISPPVKTMEMKEGEIKTTTRPNLPPETMKLYEETESAKTFSDLPEDVRHIVERNKTIIEENLQTLFEADNCPEIIPLEEMLKNLTKKDVSFSTMQKEVKNFFNKEMPAKIKEVEELITPFKKKIVETYVKQEGLEKKNVGEMFDNFITELGGKELKDSAYTNAYKMFNLFLTNLLYKVPELSETLISFDLFQELSQNTKELVQHALLLEGKGKELHKGVRDSILKDMEKNPKLYVDATKAEETFNMHKHEEFMETREYKEKRTKIDENLSMSNLEDFHAKLDITAKNIKEHKAYDKPKDWEGTKEEWGRLSKMCEQDREIYYTQKMVYEVGEKSLEDWKLSYEEGDTKLGDKYEASVLKEGGDRSYVRRLKTDIEIALDKNKIKLVKEADILSAFYEGVTDSLIESLSTKELMEKAHEYYKDLTKIQSNKLFSIGGHVEAALKITKDAAMKGVDLLTWIKSQKYTKSDGSFFSERELRDYARITEKTVKLHNDLRELSLTIEDVPSKVVNVNEMMEYKRWVDLKAKRTQLLLEGKEQRKGDYSPEEREALKLRRVRNAEQIKSFPKNARKSKAPYAVTENERLGIMRINQAFQDSFLNKITPTIYTYNEIGGEFGKQIWHKFMQAEKNAKTFERLLTESLYSHIRQQGLVTKDLIKVGTYMRGLEEGGLDALERGKIKPVSVEELSVKEQALVAVIRNWFDSVVEDVDQTHWKFTGRKLVRRENYMAVVSEGFKNYSADATAWLQSANFTEHLRAKQTKAPIPGFVKPTTKVMQAGDLNVLDVVSGYARSFARYREMNPIYDKTLNLMNRSWDLREFEGPEVDVLRHQKFDKILERDKNGTTNYREFSEMLKKKNMESAGRLQVLMDTYNSMEGKTTPKGKELRGQISEVRKEISQQIKLGNEVNTWSVQKDIPTVHRQMHDMLMQGYEGKLKGYDHNSKFDKFWATVSDNVVSATLSLSVSSWLNQAGAIPDILLGTSRSSLMTGITEAMKSDRAFQESGVLEKGGSMGNIYHDFMASSSNTRSLYKSIKQASMNPLQYFDNYIRHIAWESYRAHGVEKGLTGEALRRYADTGVVMSQSHASFVNRSPLQATFVGKLFTPLQSFSINQASFYFRELAKQKGYKEAILKDGQLDWNSLTKASKNDLWATFFKATFTNAAIGAVYNYTLDMNSPNPDIIGSMRLEAQKKDSTIPSVVWKGLAEVMTIPPFISNVKFMSKNHPENVLGTGLGNFVNAVRTMTTISENFSKYHSKGESGLEALYHALVGAKKSNNYYLASTDMASVYKVLGLPAAKQIPAMVRMWQSNNFKKQSAGYQFQNLMTGQTVTPPSKEKRRRPKKTNW
jgi:hypothetical protein